MLSLGYVVKRGMLSTGECCQTGHVVKRGMLTTGACCHRDILSTGGILSTGTYCHLGILAWGILSRGILSPGHVVSGHDVPPPKFLLAIQTDRMWPFSSHPVPRGSFSRHTKFTNSVLIDNFTFTYIQVYIVWPLFILHHASFNCHNQTQHQLNLTQVEVRHNYQT